MHALCPLGHLTLRPPLQELCNVMPVIGNNLTKIVLDSLTVVTH